MNLKVFGKNTFIYSIGTVFLRASSFLLIPLYTHYLSLSDYGLLATLLLTTQILNTLIDLGVRSGIMRFMSQYENENRIGKLLGSALSINMFNGILVSCISFIIIGVIFRDILNIDEANDYIILICLIAIFQSLCVTVISYYRATQQGLSYMLASISAGILLIITNALFLIILQKGILGILFAQISTYGCLFAFFSLKIFHKLHFGISKDIISKLLKFGFPLIFAMSGDLLTVTTAAYFLGFFSNFETVGIYNLGLKIAQIAGMVLILPFQLAYEPFVFNNLDNPGIDRTISRIITYLMFAFFIICIGIVFIFRDLIKIIAPPEYESAYLFVFFILPGIGFTGIQYVGQSLLHAKNKTNITGLIVFSFTLFSILLNYIMAKYWDIYGIIIVYNFTQIGIAYLLLVLGIKYLPISLDLKRLTVIAFMTVLSLALLFVLRDSSSYYYYSFIPLYMAVILIGIYFFNLLDAEEKNILDTFFYKLIQNKN